MTQSVRLLVLLTLLYTSSPETGWAQEKLQFEQQIRPILLKHCAECHGAEVQRSGLRLDARHAAFKGGDGGPVIVAGKAHESELLRRVISQDDDERMPPQGKPLTEQQIGLLRQWIDAGAEWTETEYDRRAAMDPRLEHWAWQAITKPDAPQLSSESLVALPAGWNQTQLNQIDRFVIAGLIEHELQPSPQADRRTLIRRLSFDLLGLPPAPEDVDRFVNDASPTAIEELVDRMLASPHYGERWAQHWLDIAHYADTHGFERDQRRDNAWRYRDWVIQALNDDMPYDQFLRDQIAGDVLRPEDPAAVAATGFLAAGPWDFVGQQETPSPVLKRLARADDLDDMVTQVMTSACGITINCARCHDHKLDPISQREYYSMWAVFSGVKRGERVLSTIEEQQLAERKAALETERNKIRKELAELQGDGWSLADIVGGGDGHGSGKAGQAIDPATGHTTDAKRGFLESATVNVFHPCPLPFVDGVVIPDGNADGRVPIATNGLLADDIPNTSGQAWDAIRNGPVNSQFSTELGGIDFAGNGHQLLSLHANAAITFDLQAMRKSGLPSDVRFVAQAGYFGQTAKAGASFHILADGKLLIQHQGIGREDGLIGIDIPVSQDVRFLTLMATDHGNNIGHDQICFGNAALVSQKSNQTPEQQKRIAHLQQQAEALDRELTELPVAARIYAVTADTPPTIKVLLRGNPEQPGDEVSPGTVSCLPLPASFGNNSLTDAQRRIALANWMTSPHNPLTARVIVNRLWHHHFGIGLVDTPSDFGLGGGQPSHPELLDWLALQLQKNGWSLKSVHRLICLSSVYQQASAVSSGHAKSVDADNRLLWRQNPRRLDAESLRDAVLATTGKLNLQMFGPGYRDFAYREEYAPVYTYITADQPELWRRSIYRFVVRTTPDPFLTTLDCPDAANMTPTRNVTTTALQSLALLNDEFMLKQAGYLAERLLATHANSAEGQVQIAFRLAFSRTPTTDEQIASIKYISTAGLAEFCRAILNANEFVYID